ncbi:hypothetical protein B0J13DRAFT_521913 [Dactylonectria estremocensis]|uniref:Protein kinase domain-containing protein n=1 Tax=Dactylonectria estremocensis TaxID=1079267 RepID=A0A9P9J9K1_9HYPO|nr:hypothetical protein B0J13DRAFT_521913 [Dactylonectria estremocensis]
MPPLPRRIQSRGSEMARSSWFCSWLCAGLVREREHKQATQIDDLGVPRSSMQDKTALKGVSIDNTSGQTLEEHQVPASPSLSFGSTVGSRMKKKTKTLTKSVSVSSSIDMAGALRTKFRDILQSSGIERQRFVSETKLKTLLNKPDVEAIIQTCEQLRNTAMIPDLAEFVVTKAYKIFAILIMIGEPHLISQFYEKKFSQEMLPIKNPLATEDGIWKLEPYNKEHSGRPFICREDSLWNDVTANHFYSQQWAFIAPKFVKNQFRYKFETERHLPFTNIEKEGNGGSAYSWVEERSVHVDHIELRSDQEPALDGDENPRVALKMLKNPDRKIAEQEATVLEMMRGLKSEHLIKAIAYYQQENDHYFMFPWAQQGNLWEFWTNKQYTPSTDRRFLTWAFTQLTGLAFAIEELHTQTQSQGGCRHGDLKPENILCFQSRVHRGDESMFNVRLVITDVGLAKVHDQATKLRATTGTTVSTDRYKAPEMEINPEGTLSRRFDIWSMGCIFLEFTIWILYGADELEQCTRDLTKWFFEIKEAGNKTNSLRVPNSRTDKKSLKTAEVHPTVKEWVTYIKEDWRCSKGTALRRLVELIVDRLLVERVEDPDGDTNNNKHSNIPPQFSGSMKRTKTWATADPPATDSPTTDYSKLRTCRSYATKMREELAEILAGLKDGTIEPTAKRKSEETEIPKGPSHQRLATQNGTTNRNVSNNFLQYFVSAPRDISSFASNYSCQTLNDNWDYTPDDAIAKGFSHVGFVTPAPQKTSFCSRCRALEPCSLGCQFTDSPAGLDGKARDDGCALCQLLSHCIRGRAVHPQEMVNFARVGSYLTIDDGREQPVANLYMIPEPQTCSLQNIQIGLPNLPDAGSAAHFRTLREWLDSCDSAHQCFPEQVDFTPTRLLDVSYNDYGTVKLLDRGHDQVKSKKYVALSHRWGSPKHHAKFCASKSNIDILRGGIKVSALPKTFQDAVDVTRGLGLCRLWIDSVCIIQDDMKDWDTESKLMERVFSSAYCTIAASCASGNSDGFLKPRLERRYVPMQAHTNIDTTYYVCEAIDDFHAHVDLSELNQRGWVMQERALSRRTIFFTETQSYWECGGGVRCETMTRMKNRKASFLGDSDFPRSADKYVKGMKIELFQDLYERYSKLGLSFVSDRSVAIKGLETRLLTTFGTTGGYGIFDIYLHRCLLWQRAGDNLKHITSTRGSPVPSWSWMAYDGAICYLPVPFGKALWCNDIESPFTKATEQHALGENKRDNNGVGGQSLELKAPVWDLVNDPAGSIVLDIPSQASIQPLKCVVVGKSKPEIFGERQTHWVLLVRCVEDSGNDANGQVYERIGVGVLDRRDIAFHGSGSIIRFR